VERPWVSEQLRLRDLRRVRQFGKVTAGNPKFTWVHISSSNSASNPGGWGGLGRVRCGHHANLSLD
jgi:hypothetical protein